jgi:hypothetical protein
MTKVRIYKMPKGAMKAELRELLSAAGCVIVEEDDECLVLIVLLDSDLLQDKDLENALLEAAREDRRVIGVWPKGVTSGKTPACFEDYRSDTVIWNPDRLRDAVKGKPQHDAPSGKPIPYPETPRNKCHKNG